MYKLLIVTPLLLVSCKGANAPESDTFTLYRNSVLDKNMRIHVATFDSKDGFSGKKDLYNKENCEDSAKLRMSQPLVQTKFWCEKGFYKE